MVSLAVTLRDDLHVIARLVVRRHAVVLVNRTLASVVTSECELDVSREPLQQPAQIFCSRVDVLNRIVRMLATKTLRSRRHQLHQALSPRMRERLLLVLWFLPNHGVNEARVHTLFLTS